MKKTFLFSLVFAAVFSPAKTQTVQVPLTLDAWDTIGSSPVHENFLGKESFLLQSGVIIVKNAALRDGTIEADISFPRERSFPGFAVRMQDLKNFENFYVRPHQSGNPDASQYTPMFNGQAGWQLYYGKGYSGQVTYHFNQWHHIKIDLHGLKAEFYVDDVPVIKVEELLTGWKSGKIGIISDGASLHIANVQYTVKQESAPTPNPVPTNGVAGVVTQWELSNAVENSLFRGQYELSKEIKNKLQFTARSSEYTGTLNLARFGSLSDSTNTMVVRLKVESNADQLKGISFGFSDYVKVYLNDRIIYSGNDNFMSRDYRFLGTIGFFDELFLPLKKGMNEIWFVISEDFGGWGMKAKFENMENITLM